ncbi:MAG TPA: hypothetical protein VFA78_03010 [Chloroflexota bacterium]|nr:hypothetical protein [Chloroflexota bacterium]
MGTSVDQSAAAVTHVSFTLHVPPGLNATQIVHTPGVAGSFESVDVVPDSVSGYTVVANVSTASDSAEPATLTTQVVSRSSTWASASGPSNSDLTVVVTNG